MATHRVLGINFPLLSIYEKEGLNIDLMINNYHLQIDRALVNRYKHDIKYKTVYVDLDDTLILNDRINTELIKFLYQSLNKDCKLILITKSVNITENYLKKWRLANLFDEIIFLNNEDSKADHVDPENSIFIDDSFSERKSVFDKHKIPTFDCSMLELLIDSKV